MFWRSKKNNTKWRRRRKILRVRCRNLAFYTTEPLNEPFFAEQKNEKWLRRQKKNQGTAISQRHSRGSTTVLPGGEKMRGKKIESALIWGRHLQKGLVKSVGFFFPSRFLCFFFFFENQFLEKLVFKTSFFNHPNTLESITVGMQDVCRVHASFLMVFFFFFFCFCFCFCFFFRFVRFFPFYVGPPNQHRFWGQCKLPNLVRIVYGSVPN